MTPSEFKPGFRQCDNPICRFRFPATELKHATAACPLCRSTTSPVELPIRNSLRPESTPPEGRIHVVVDNIRSVFNCGSIFRTCDALGVVIKIHLCGITPTPAHVKFAKTSLGAEKSIPYEYHTNTLDCISRLKAEQVTLFGIEMEKSAHNLFDLTTDSIPSKTTTAIVVGNEVCGIDPAVMRMMDTLLYIPMHGIKESLNVAVAFSIVAYHLYDLLTKKTD